MTTQHIETIVIGGGQAGMTVGHQLGRLGRPFLILDAHERIGDAWRKRWDSLRLFTPAKFDGLPGMAFPAAGGAFIGKDEMADFLESYAEALQLPIRTGARVDRLSRDRDGFEIRAGDDLYRADNVVVAMSSYQVPWTPSCAAGLDPRVVQIHSSAYRNPSQLPDGPVLVVGAGNSGADIALELARDHEVWLSGNDTGEVPFRIESGFGIGVGIPMVRVLGHHVLNTRTPVGRKVRPKMLVSGGPRVRVKQVDLESAGVVRVPRVAGSDGGQPQLEDGSTLEVSSVVWATGYRPGFSWIDLPVLDDRGTPLHERGVVAAAPGLYFVGLHFLHAATSSTITGMPRDARHVVRHLHRRMERLERAATAKEPVTPKAPGLA